MTVRLGVIADDFTGATDIAGFLVTNGLRTIQVSGVPDEKPDLTEVDAIVVSLKSRSIPAPRAVELSLGALRWLQSLGAERILFKYCSTFDSTPAGNIGPVTDALLDALGADITIVCPSLPVNGRSVYLGYLFAGAVPLNESGMQNHPVTPMTDSSLVRLMEGQSAGRAAVVPWPTIAAGPRAIRAAIDDLAALLDAEKIDRVVVTGASYGTTLAQGFGVRYPGRVAGMVLDSTVLSAEDHHEVRRYARSKLWEGEDPALSDLAAKIRILVQRDGRDPVALGDTVRLMYE